MVQVPTPGPTAVPTVRPTSRPSLVSALMPLSKDYTSMQTCIVPIYVHEIERLTGAVDDEDRCTGTVHCPDPLTLCSTKREPQQYADRAPDSGKTVIRSSLARVL